MRNQITPDYELFQKYRGILFLKEEFGGFNSEEIEFLLPRVIRGCRDSYVEGKTLEKEVYSNDGVVRVKIRGLDVVRAR